MHYDLNCKVKKNFWTGMKIYTAIPFDELVRKFKIKESNKGTKNIFSPKGKIALMLLKHYAACSYKKIIEQLNRNINYQIFCDIL